MAAITMGSTPRILMAPVKVLRYVRDPPLHRHVPDIPEKHRHETKVVLGAS